MIKTLWLIGIGTGSLSHLTLEGQQALRDAAVILLPLKGDDKEDLAQIRYDLIRASGSQAQIVPFDYPTRDPLLPYQIRVARWHDDIARRWQDSIPTGVTGPVALLVWGDPALYDSTMRIASRLTPEPDMRVIPGITAVQALTAAHAIPLNDVNGPFTVTTGRRLHDAGWPPDTDRLIVMLDGEARFADLPMPDATIWWGAYLGSPQQVIRKGRLGDVAHEIKELRAQLRETHGWIMDTYMIKRS